MSGQQISHNEVAEILGSDFGYPAATFASVWETMKISRVWRRESDFLPDSLLDLKGVLEFFLPVSTVLPAVPA